MSILAKEFRKILQERELLYQVTNMDENFKINGIYCGFDATAKSLQIGNLLCISFLRLAQKTGIKTIALLGGATTKVGDPTGKNEARKKLEENAISENINQFHGQISRLLPGVKILNNETWLNDWKFMDFLCNTAGNFSLSSLLKLKTFATRLEQNLPLSLQEFMYPIMQAYDFLWLYENEGCNAEFGGGDQWCNILTGVELIHSKYGQNSEVYEGELNKNRSETKALGLTLPLLLNSAGQKMGKSVSGAIYLSGQGTAFDFWQFWRNIEDSMVIPCLKKFTLLELSEIEKLAKLSNINDAKIALANEVTTWIHGLKSAEMAHNQAQKIFCQKNLDDFEKVVVNSGKLVEIIVATKAVKSNSEAKSLIEQNAVKINNSLITDKEHMENSQEFSLSIGKKKFFKIVRKI